MAKMLPAGTANAPWKRVPSGFWVPGFPQSPSGRDVDATQELMRDVYVAAGSKNVIFCTSAGFAAKQQTVAGRCNRNYNICSNRLDWTAPTAASEPVLNTSVAAIGGRASFSTQGARYFLNATNLPAPGTQPLYRKSVCILDQAIGGRCWFGSTANRFGVYTGTARPESVVLSNTAVSNIVDQPLSRWGVMTFCMRNSASAYPNGDFLQFGSSLNRASGIAVGNTDPVSVGKFAIISGTQGMVGSEAFEMAWTQALTDAESQAVDNLLNAHFGGNLLIYSSTGNIRSAGIGWLGSSQTYYTQGAAVSYQGARYRFFTNYVTTLGYPLWTTGHTSSGTWAQAANDGISALGINVDSGGANPGAGNAAANAYFVIGGASPNAGAGWYRFINLELGGADVAAGLWVAGTTAAALLVIAKTLATANPLAVIGINTICPQSGDPPAVAAFSLEISGAGGIWDQFDTWAAANSRLNCARIDLNQCINGGVYTAALFVDTVHLNQTGQFLWGDEIDTKTSAAMNLATTY